MKYIKFIWDENKAESNIKKHEVTFRENETQIRIITARKADKQEQKQYWRFIK